MDMDVQHAPTDEFQGWEPHPVFLFIRACFSMFLWLLAWIRILVTFSTYSVPRFLYATLSYSLTLRLTFPYLVAIFTVCAVALSVFAHYRYFTKYAQLKEPPLGKPDAKELHPDHVVEDTPPPFHNYLDEFLQAVRVFGFLERPVFHELARHLQTRRLIAGDTLSLDQDNNFYAVIDGLVQVYAQQAGAVSDVEDTLDDEDFNGYQLINEVGSGGMLSSLFTILSLFTEDVAISWPETSEEGPDTSDVIPDADRTYSPLDIGARLSRQDSGAPDLSSWGNPASPRSFTSSRRSSMLSMSSTKEDSGSSATVDAQGRPQSTMPGQMPGQDFPVLPTPAPQLSQTVRDKLRRIDSKIRMPVQASEVRGGTVARAGSDVTLAVIPAEAFRRLTKNFPKASAHIVQVILTRFSRVTFNVSHKYLGLTTELLRTEKSINDLACHPLPSAFYEGGGMLRLRQRFAPEINSQNGVDPIVEDDYFGYEPVSPSGSTARNTPYIRAQDFSRGTSGGKPKPTARSIRSGPSPMSQIAAGDLFSTTHLGGTYAGNLHRTYSNVATPHVSQEKNRTSTSILVGQASVDDFDLREEVMMCLARSIGLHQPPTSAPGSAERSPIATPMEKGVLYDSPLRSLTMLHLADDASSITGNSATPSSVLPSGIDNAVEILYFTAGSTLVHAGERNAGLFFVIDGFLECFLPVDDTERPRSGATKTDSSDLASKIRAPRLTASIKGIPPPMPKKKASTTAKYLFTVRRGGIAGYLSALSGMASYIDIRAKTDVYVGFLPSHALERLVERQPIVLLTLAKRLISLLSPIVLHIDSALDWMQVNAGQVLWREGDTSDSFYIVINGRLRAFVEKDSGGMDIVGEYGQGDTIGELDVITGSSRRTTLHAIRDTELVRMPVTLFNAISLQHPRATVQLLRMIASRTRNEADSTAPSIASPLRGAFEHGRNNLNLKTVAILPVTKEVPIATFAKKLQAALESIGAPTSYLDQNVVTAHLGRHAFTRVGKLKVAGWFADQEQHYRIVLYVADSPASSPWTQTCIRQADCVLMVGLGDDPGVGEYERILLSVKTTARKELVLLHPERTVTPGTTREWLKSRTWVHAHHHVELPGLIIATAKAPVPLSNPAAIAALKNLKDRVQSGIQRYRRSNLLPRPRRQDHTNDFARLARRLCGKSVGVVLGGGGARGLAHLGALRALEERGVPIDLIGGTSIGSFIGGLYAREGDLLSSAGRAKWFSARLSNVWRVLSDVTWPVIAYTTGHEFNRAIYKCFYDVHIEDMWIPFFCNTVSLNWSRMEVHDTGYAWRYIRASMTLVGLLPPLSDNGNMLVDGGYVDNLPVSTMLSKGANTVFAVDVAGVDDTSPRYFGDSVSGWWVLINKWNPFSSVKNIPAITEIQGRLTYVSSVKMLEEAKASPGCMYMRMPVQQYGIMDFGKFGEIQKIGYNSSVEILDKWQGEGKLPIPRADESAEGGEEKKGKKGRRERRNSI